MVLGDDKAVQEGRAPGDTILRCLALAQLLPDDCESCCTGIHKRVNTTASATWQLDSYWQQNLTAIVCCNYSHQLLMPAFGSKIKVNPCCRQVAVSIAPTSSSWHASSVKIAIVTLFLTLFQQTAHVARYFTSDVVLELIYSRKRVTACLLTNKLQLASISLSVTYS